jgi:hypothetical protein
MARITMDELQDYSLAVARLEVPVMDGGMPVFNGTGEPKTEEGWQLIFTMQSPAGLHIVKSPIIDKRVRDNMIQAFTGVVPASTIDLPPGL